MLVSIGAGSCLTRSQNSKPTSGKAISTMSAAFIRLQLIYSGHKILLAVHGVAHLLHIYWLSIAFEILLPHLSTSYGFIAL